jgi:hypothetical protein
VTFLEPIRVGFWKSEGRAKSAFDSFDQSDNFLARLMVGVATATLESHLPSVWDYVDPTWDPRERELVLRYVSEPRWRGESCCGYSTCRICGKNDNGSADFSDGLYVWPEGFAHYISQHAVRPPRAFIKHVLKHAWGQARSPR